MSDAVLQTIFQVLGGGVFGFLIARYTAIQQRAKKHITYKTSKIKLLHLHEDTPDSIKVTVDKSIITGDEQDNGEHVPIKSAVAHSIALKNKGNSTASDVNFDIIFSDDVDILAYSSTPAPSEFYKIELGRVSENRNILRVFVPYLNQNSEIVLSVVATVEESPSSPKIIGTGKEVEVSEFKKTASPFPIIIIFFATLFIAMAMFEGTVVQGSIGSDIPDTWARFLGGTIETVEVRVLSFPTLNKVLAILLGVLLLGVAVYRFIVKNRF